MSLIYSGPSAGPEYLRYSTNNMSLEDLCKFLANLAKQPGASGAVPLSLAQGIYPSLNNSHTCDLLNSDAEKYGFTAALFGREILFSPNS